MPTWSITHLEDMPTLAQRRGAELKFDNGETRVWLERGTPADRENASAVTVERLQEDGTWRAVR